MLKITHFRKAILLAFLLPILLNATSSFVLKDDSLKPEATEMIDKIGNELFTKTRVNAYVLATDEAFPVGFNLVKYSKNFQDKMNVPFVLYIFAPNALITEKAESTGRVGLIASSEDVKTLYDYDEVKNAGLDIIAVKDKNSISDKHNIGVLQAYSELADQIAESKNIDMTTTIPNDTRTLISIIRFILIIGLVLVTWIYVVHPILYRRKKND